MTQYSQTTCPEPVRTQINNLVATFQQMLSSNLVGIYLHGSLAIGCFNPQRSDIDLLVVTRNGMAVETKRDVVQYLLANSLSPSPLEISFLVQKDIHPFQHPLPYDLHYSESWRERYTRALADGTWNDEKKYDNDLSAHLTITHVRGICLDGEPIDKVFPPVPPVHYTASILGDFKDANAQRQQMPVYFTLNSCRVLAYLREGYICSKDEGGAWGLQTLPAELHAVVKQALEAYRGNLPDTPFDEAALTRFAHYMEYSIKPTC
ncbi:MAG TPA: aminoglycoside adenylyltransferase domain-containing protein [Ktedonobacteraceae bacterium]|nr:aminoglycoside adenylyltransferase domain-containing protein [Ktedonobacteraceae bacterium]